MATASSPHLDRRTTLKDALAMLIDAEVQVGIVVDRHGALRGLVTAEMIIERMRPRPPDDQVATAVAGPPG
jgi:Mg2+/Co2+ transporter CorB